MKLLHYIDNWLNNITMYRLLLYGLGLLIAIAALFCFTDVLALSGIGLLLSTVILLSVCFISNRAFGKLYDVPVNTESSLITALILVCIMPPVTSVSYGLGAALAGFIAMASKYVFVWRHKHVFNPAAFGAVAIGLLGIVFASWWIGNPSMLPFTLLLGVLILRKVRRIRLFLVFALSALLVGALVGLQNGEVISSALRTMVVSGPLIFMGTIMLTEPATMPATRHYRSLFALIVGVVFASQLHVTELLSTSPERALLIGNLFAFAVTYRARLTLRLKEKIKISPVVYDYVFTANYPFRFIPGQYMEWTLPLRRSDSRGNRRTFTIASSPTEKEIHLGVKFYEKGSAFKRHLSAMKPGDSLAAGVLSGDFLLPADASKKLVWIAGGIGITPFRSQAKYLVDKEQKREIELFYVVSKPDEVAYLDVLKAARSVGVRSHFILNSKDVPAGWKGSTGPLTTEQLKAVSDWQQRTYYISGPNAMVDAYKSMLRNLGIPRRQIVTDHFSGY